VLHLSQVGSLCLWTQIQKIPRNKGDEAQFAQDEDSDSDEVILMATNKGDEEKNDEWYLYIGCSNDITCKKYWFSELEDSVNVKIKFVDNNIVCAEGIGKVMIHRKDGKRACITNVLDVPNMKSNLISIGQLLQNGYTMKMKEQTMRVFYCKNMLILKVPLSKQRTFKININVIEDQCLLFETKNDN
jgi:hypothetical protein